MLHEIMDIFPKYMYLINAMTALSLAYLFYRSQKSEKLRNVFILVFLTIGWRDIWVFVDLAFIHDVIQEVSCWKLLLAMGPQFLAMIILSRFLWKTYQHSDK